METEYTRSAWLRHREIYRDATGKFIHDETTMKSLQIAYHSGQVSIMAMLEWFQSIKTYGSLFVPDKIEPDELSADTPEYKALQTEIHLLSEQLNITGLH